jgi:hypothetical protein
MFVEVSGGTPFVLSFLLGKGKVSKGSIYLLVSLQPSSSQRKAEQAFASRMLQMIARGSKQK